MSNKKSNKKPNKMVADNSPLLANKEMYIISIDDKGTPFLLDGEVILLYSKKEKADEAVRGFCRLYGVGSVQCVKLSDPQSFWPKVGSCGINGYIVDGDSEIYSIVKKISLNPKKIIRKNSLLSLQPNKKKRIKKKTITIGGANLYLPQFSLYLSIISYVLYLLFNGTSGNTTHSGSMLAILAVSLCGIIIGFANFLESVNEKQKISGMSVLGIIIGLIIMIKCILKF